MNLRSTRPGRGWPIQRGELKRLLGLPLLLLVLLAAACGGDEPLTTLSPKSDVAENVQSLFVFIFWMAAFVFIVIEGLLIFVVLRFRRRPADGMPKQTHGHKALEIVWTIVPIPVLLAILIPTWQVIFDNANTPEGAMRIEVTAHQWWWEVRYPDLGVVTANEIHVPVGQPVGISLLSDDVIHSFWVPQLSGKQDMVPGRTNSIWFTPLFTGVFQGQCAELCGESHAHMKFQVEVDEQGAFDAWVASQNSAAAPPQAAGAAGADLFISKGCLACHTIDGTLSAGVIGPNLTHVGGRSTLGAGMLENSVDGLARWIRDPDAVKPGNVMSRDGAMYQNAALALTDAEIDALAAYLDGLN